MLKSIAKLGAGLMCAATMALLATGTTWAQDNNPSDKVVEFMMNFAWTQTPAKYTPPGGKTVVIDKKSPKKVKVPVEVAREVIKVGYASGEAQRCGLMAEQKANFDTMMRRQEATGKWSDQQLVYILKLHQATVMQLNSRATFVEREGKKIVARRPAKSNWDGKCTAAKRKSVQTQIANYIKGQKK